MTEDRLSHLLKELTPEPPRALTLADLAPGAQRNHARLWLAPIAAAVGAAVVIAATVWVVRAHISAAPQPVTHQPSPAPALIAPACAATALVPSMVNQGAVASQPFDVIAMTNRSSHACSVTGYPSIKLHGWESTVGAPTSPLQIRIVDGSIYEVPDPGPHAITLAPGAAASFAIGTNTATLGGKDTAGISDVEIALPDGGGDVPFSLGDMAASYVPGHPAQVGITAFQSLRLNTSDETFSGSPTWDAQPLADQQADAIVGTSGSLYSVLNENSETTITRINPTSGRTLDQISYQDSDVATFSLRPPILAGGSLWIASDPDSDGVVQLRAFDPTTLMSRHVLKLSFAGAGAVNAQTSFAAGPSGTLYVGAGHGLVTLDPTTDEVTRRIDVGAGYVAGIAVAPDDSRFYVGVMPDVTGALVVRTDLQSRDPRTGTIIREVGGTATFGPGIGGIQAMMASAGGVWIANAVGGNGEQVLFVPADLDLVQTSVPAAAQGGGGVVAFATLANNTVWIGGGTGGLACADPVSGRRRYSTVLPNDTFIFDVTYAGGRAFAIEDADGSRRVVSIQPPSLDCGP